MIKLEDKKDCCGCNVCVDICPVKAISLKTDDEGFWYPNVDVGLCTECKLCENRCPQIVISRIKKNDFEYPICYAAVHKNLETRFDSTSGGLFSALAESIYNEGGYVGGAIYNDDFSVSHYISNDKKDLQKLRSSKYQQSDASGLYKEVKSLLIKGEKVLVCGTPCQMAGLRSFLHKDYENLIIADFICLGVNSPMVHRKFVDSLELKAASKLIYIKAKSKELGWRNLSYKYKFENGTTSFDTRNTCLFTRGYISTRAFCRPSCYDCKFKGFPRIADVTLADFWGIERIDKSLDHDLGTSMVLLNSKKGQAYFETVKNKIRYREVDFETILPGNPALLSSIGAPLVDRKKFFQDINIMSFDAVAERYFPFPKDGVKIYIKNILRILLSVKRNIGFRFFSLWSLFRYNFLLKRVLCSWIQGGAFIAAHHSLVKIDKTATVVCSGRFIFGYKKHLNSKIESRLMLGKNAKLQIDGDFRFGYGSEVDILEGGELIIKGGNGGSNMNTTIVCSHKIELGTGVQIGRNVTIRDNNGGHYIARQGYKDSRPVKIGDRVWLCEGCTIMPGVKIGDGAIIGAHSLVISNVPAHTIVSGNPAQIVDEDVLWKY